MADKTEAPTAGRIRDARERGQVARSMELNAAVSLIASIWLLTGMGRNMISGLGDLMRHTVTNLPTAELTDLGLRQLVFQDFSFFFIPFVELIFALMIIGVMTTLLQTNFLWASKRPFFDGSRLNPINGFKRIFSKQGIIEVLKSLLKLLLVGWPVYTFLMDNFTSIIQIIQMPLRQEIEQWMNLSTSLMWRVAGAYIILAAGDYAYQRWNYTRQLRMSKQEVIDDLKKSEGDPFLRGRIRQQQRRMAQSRMMSKVPKADVIVTNPTHYAVAIKYDSTKMEAPVVVAKGAFNVAQKIVEIARENSVPVVQNVPLARAMYKMVDLDQPIPPELYVAMAEVLAYVYRLKNQHIQPVSAQV
ncbi:flagellar biosynthetic protein FlhB [Leptolinea sp. HRD-7]|jgi:flagellar biosynthetic protein FlhB|nr:flagellar biosynthetic protein FlhB [Leptolinea sp. HRD-7]